MYRYRKLDSYNNVIEERHYKFASILRKMKKKYYRRIIETKAEKEIVCQQQKTT